MIGIGFQTSNETGATLPSVAFGDIKDSILGKGYQLNLVFVGAERIRLLNLTYRGKDKPTDILSFPLSGHTGEIYICASEARKEAPKFGLSFEKFLAYLFIHGCAHLKGYDHGATMEALEERSRKKFGI